MLRFTSWLAAAALVAAVGCVGTSEPNGPGPSAGGSSGQGGSGAGAGGVPGSGGASATGGTPGGGSGGVATGAGGVATGTGGRAGASGNGGAPGTGGVVAGTGGAPGTGGVTGTGGATAAPFKGVANSACADMPRLKVGWFYNWTLSPSNCTASEFVPMVAGKSEKTAAAVTTAITQVAQRGYKIVLGFNEPNKADQSNLTVAQVVSMWPQLTANADLRVSSPATSADAAGQTWFTDFMNQVGMQGLRVDFIALHWYGWNAGSCDAKAVQLENYIKWAEGLPGGRPIWITEWGCLNQSNPDIATVQAFYTGAVAMFAKHPRIERYAWYPWTANNELVDTAGALTPLGTAFANAPTTR